ncbi:MAG: prepilin-type N-terminal cleavage/methylation domain-containing protein [Planctomycetota bacterium]|nr:prepilin-type N-terminal cleavage/methylation domain-containing protein [Planctomycetota bacterium]
MTNQSAIPPRLWPRRGFTLIELLVAVGILVIMLLAFGQIVAQSQALVNGCQQIMKMNTTASVVAQLLQRDLLSVSKDGSLAVESGKLTFTRVASHTSMDPTATATINANAAVVNYGRKDYGGESGGVLYRQATLLTGRDGPTAKDALAANLGTDTPSITIDLPASIDDLFLFKPGDAGNPGSRKVYIGFLATGCTRFDSYCWDDAGKQFTSSKTFTSTNVTNWPKAVKVVFALQEAAEKQQYELIVDIP